MLHLASELRVLMINMMLDEVIVGSVGSGLSTAVLYRDGFRGRPHDRMNAGICGQEDRRDLGQNDGLSAALRPCGYPGPHCGCRRCRTRPRGARQPRAAQILYVYTSATATNSSAFAGLNANTAFNNLTLSLAMFIRRFFVIIPVLAIPGSLAAKRVVPGAIGTLPTGRG